MAELIKMKTGYIPEPELEKGVVYVLEIDDGTVKIGSTKNLEQRLKSLKSNYKKYDKSILRYACTENITQFQLLEYTMHLGLDEWYVYSPVNRESYKCSFENIVNLIPIAAYFLKEYRNINVI